MRRGPKGPAARGEAGMAQKYISLDDAADQLGVSKDRLLAMRESGAIHGYRDGASWKFKIEEIDRLKAEGITEEAGSPGILDSDDLELETVDDVSEVSDSILLSEIELGESDASSPSTIIGGRDSTESSDLELSSDSGLELDTSIGDAKADFVESADAGASDLELESSDVLSAGASDVLDMDVDTELGSQFENLEELDVDLESQSSRIVADEQSPPTASGGESELSLEEASSAPEGELSLDSVLGGSAASGGSEIELIDDEDSELVLGEGSGSDITLSSEDSGISLLGPSDSGLSLDDPDFTLGGSAAGVLDLGEEKPGAGLAEDDDFQLTPLDHAPDEDEESGSQVIALDSQEEIDEGAATQLGAASFGEAAVVVEEEAPVLLEAEDMVEETAQSSGLATVGAPGAAAAPVVTEARFSPLVVTSLAFAVVLLGLTAIMMFDLVRNMWSWNEPYTLDSPLMNWLWELLGPGK